MYHRGQIYKIVPSRQPTVATDMTYYGSSVHTLSHRFSHHKDKYRHFNTTTNHRTSAFKLFDKYGIDGCEIHLVEDFPCKTKQELHARERFYIENNPCVNERVPGRTRGERLASKQALKQRCPTTAQVSVS